MFLIVYFRRILGRILEFEHGDISPWFHGDISISSMYLMKNKKGGIMQEKQQQLFLRFFVNARDSCTFIKNNNSLKLAGFKKYIF